MFYTPGVTLGIFMSSIILASASPQRKRLLEGLGIDFVVIPSQVNEEACTELHPSKRAQMLAREKADEVASRHRGRWVVGCDTLVESPYGTLLEKAVDAADARRMLTLQSGGVSMVHSGLALVRPDGAVFDGLSTSNVCFRNLTDTDKDWWIASNFWKDRSGSFQIDGPGQLMIERIEGDWTSVVGFPVFLFGKLAKEAGFSFED